MVRNQTFELAETTLKASFNVEQIAEDKALQFVSLFIGETILVDNQFNAKEKRLPSGEIENLNDIIQVEMDISEVDQDFIFARIGVKTQGNPELIFSEVKKIELN